MKETAITEQADAPSVVPPGGSRADLGRAASAVTFPYLNNDDGHIRTEVLEALAQAVENRFSDLSRAASPTYKHYRCGKTMTPAHLLAEVRRVHPGAVINCHASFITEVGPADDLAVLFGVQMGELFVIAEGRK